MSLANKTVAGTYKDLLTVLGSTQNQGLESTRKQVFDGEGIGSTLFLGTTSTEFTGPITTTSSLTVGGDLTVSGSNDAAIGGNLAVTGTITGDGSGLTGVAAGFSGSYTGNSTFTGQMAISTTTSINTSYAATSNVFKVYTSDNSQYLTYHASSGNLEVRKGDVYCEGVQITDDNGNDYEIFSVSTAGNLILHQDMETKSQVTFKASSGDDLVLDADDRTFSKGTDKGGLKLEDTEVKLRKGTTDLFTMKEDGTARIRSVSTLPTTNTAIGDMVNLDGKLYIKTS